jgi:hypothetical protein
MASSTTHFGKSPVLRICPKTVSVTPLLATRKSGENAMPTDPITLQTHLWRMPEYRALDPKRRKLASAILLENQSLTAACNAIGGLNSTRGS